MAKTGSFLSSLLFSSFSLREHQQLQQPMFFLFFSLSVFSMCFLLIFLYKRLQRVKEEDEKSTQKSLSIFNCCLSKEINKTNQSEGTTHQSHLTHPLFAELITSNPSKWAPLLSSLSSHVSIDDNQEDSDERLTNGPELDKDGGDSIGEDCEKIAGQTGKKKKKRAKKKRQNSRAEDDVDDANGCFENKVSGTDDKPGLDRLYPFTSSSSVTQKKIKLQYDQIVKSHDSKALTMAQVGEFANCLINAKNELQHKSEIIQRKFTITKALLFRADRSSFDRICQQIYKLEAEQKRLEEDTIVYNRLQQQLKLSPAYRQMLEIGVRMELNASSGQIVESPDTEFSDISFEELLAQEKKDSFWQRNGKQKFLCRN